MSSDDDVELPTGKELTDRWSNMARAVQSDLWRKVRRGETSQDKHEALLIAAMAKQRLRDWTMRPELVIPAFVGAMWVLSLAIEDFSFSSALVAPLAYSAYLLWMRGAYTRAYRRSMEVLRGEREDGSALGG
jgi:hypothetical protein